MSAGDVRCFLAANLSTETLQKLQAAQRQLQEQLGAAASALRWVAIENVHLTFKFFGHIPEASLAAIEDRVGRVLRDEPPLSFESFGMGAFPTARSPRVVWAGVREGEPKRLPALAEKLEGALEELGYARETRAFKPHLTLARVREGEKPNLAEALQGFADVAFGATRAAELILYKSDLSRGGARYSVLKRIFFQRPS